MDNKPNVYWISTQLNKELHQKKIHGDEVDQYILIISDNNLSFFFEEKRRLISACGYMIKILNNPCNITYWNQ